MTAALPPAMALTYAHRKSEYIRRDNVFSNIYVTSGENMRKTGKLNGATKSTTPLGSAFVFGLMAKKLKLKSVFWGLDHFSALSYDDRTSMYVAVKSELSSEEK